MKIFCTSDEHFGHKNIIKYCDRPFSSVEDMDDELIKRWNNVVGDDDTIYCLGDFSLAREKEDIIRVGNKLKGHKILIKGNHDHASTKTYLDAGFEMVVKEPYIIYVDDTKVYLSHHRMGEENGDFINYYGHVHDKPNDDDTHRCMCVELFDYTPVCIYNCDV